MTKKVRIGSVYKNSKLIFEDGIRNPSPRIPCPACSKTYSTRAGYSRHADKHVKKGELVVFIVNPKADIHLQRYGYKLPE